MNPQSLRAWLAVVLAGSALLFFVGIYLERNVTTSRRPGGGCSIDAARGVSC